jgi:Ca2+-binding RTX toxin-like protein
VATVNDGSDSYFGGTGALSIDTYDLSLTAADATVTSTNSTSAQTGNDSLNSIENFIGSQGNDNMTMSGAVVNNRIDGQAGNDNINANGGDDVLIGGVGNDTMIGGAGNDRFVFELAGFGNDTITGVGGLLGGKFDDGTTPGVQDLLDISGLGVNAGNFVSVLIGQGPTVNDTLVTIGADTITIIGVNAANIDLNDFILAS